MLHNIKENHIRTLLISAILIIGYSLVHAWWIQQYPPVRNNDHFVNAIMLTQLEEGGERLYPRDPAWSSTEFRDTQGRIYRILLEGMTDITGNYLKTWPYFTFFFLVIYISGFYFFLMEVTRQHWLSLIFAIATTMPVYMNVTLAPWGIASLYARVFVMIFSGWILLLFFKVLKAGTINRWMLLMLAVCTALLVYLNPVNGGGLLGMITIMLFSEIIARRLRWDELAFFLLAALIILIPFLSTYTHSLAPTGNPTPEEIQQANDFIVDLAAHRLYPWHLNPTLAPLLLAVVLLSAIVTFAGYSHHDPPRWWTMIFVIIQLAPAYLMIGTPIFLLALAYWWFRTTTQQVDRWDRLLLVMLTATNLIGPVTSAISQYFWLEHQMNGFFTLAYETIRLLRWVMVPIYVFVARWIAELLEKEHKAVYYPIVAMMFAASFSIFGNGNITSDDGVQILVRFPIRWGLAIAAIGFIWVAHYAPHKRIPTAIPWLIAAILAGGAFGSIGRNHPPQELSVQGTIIFSLFALLVAYIIYAKPHQERKTTTGMMLMVLMTVFSAIAAYHREKQDLNGCRLPELTPCVSDDDLQQAGERIYQSTPLDAQLLVLGMQPERFQSLARRSTMYIDYYQIFWFKGATGLLAGIEQAAYLEGIDPFSTQYPGDETLTRAMKAFGAEYIVVIGDYFYELDLPVLYQNESVTVYQYLPDKENLLKPKDDENEQN